MVSKCSGMTAQKDFSIAINEFNSTIIAAIFKGLHLMGYKVIYSGVAMKALWHLYAVIATRNQMLYRGIGGKLKVVRQNFIASFMNRIGDFYNF